MACGAEPDSAHGSSSPRYPLGFGLGMPEHTELWTPRRFPFMSHWQAPTTASGTAVATCLLWSTLPSPLTLRPAQLWALAVVALASLVGTLHTHPHPHPRHTHPFAPCTYLSMPLCVFDACIAESLFWRPLSLLLLSLSVIDNGSRCNPTSFLHHQVRTSSSQTPRC